MKFYAGIGSRETPVNILYMMKKLARALGKSDWTLRSGGAKGADSAFYSGIKNYHKDLKPTASRIT